MARSALWSRSSIAARLFVYAALCSLVILTVAGLVLTTMYRSASESALDEKMSVYLQALVADLANPSEDSHAEPVQMGEPQFELPLSGWYWQISRLGDDQTDIRTSRSLFAAHLPRLPASAQTGKSGQKRGYVQGPDDRRLRQLERVINAGDDGEYLVQVAATTEGVDAQIHQFEFELGVTFVLLALALMAAMASQVHYGLRPLRMLSQRVTHVRQGEASTIDGVYPEEIAPLANELNLLIAANRDIVERARTQLGNLAHALKTPLSVILNETADHDDPMATKTQQQALIMRDQVTFYLDRARAQTRIGALGVANDVYPIVEGMADTFSKIYRTRDIAFEGAGAESVRFLGERQDLEDLLGNLIDNACKWARQSVQITLVARPAASAHERAVFVTTIDDDGPGLPEAQRQEATQRGRRLDESKPGSGLGLSIVVELAAAYGGELTLDAAPLGGLRAVLTLPAL